jgi:hypothetical protein
MVPRYNFARWMAQMIYGIKILFFCEPFHVTAKDLAGLWQFNVFIIQPLRPDMIYI